MEVIRSIENKKIKQFSSLKQSKYRNKYKQFIIEEKHLIYEAYNKKALRGTDIITLMKMEIEN